MDDTAQTTLMEDRGGYQVTRFNALRHGVLSRFTVLPWEGEEEYRALLEAFIAKHVPHGPTEEHLVEELAGVIWRKRRLRLAEGAALQWRLKRVTSPYEETVKAALAHLNPCRQIEKVGDAITATAKETEAELADLWADEAMTNHALELLAAAQAGAYDRGLGVLREDTRA